MDSLEKMPPEPNAEALPEPETSITRVVGAAWDPAPGPRERHNWDERAALMDGSSTIASSSSAAPCGEIVAAAGTDRL